MRAEEEQRLQKQRCEAAIEASRKAAAAQQERRAFNARPFVEQNAALALSELAQKDANAGLGADEMQMLINALIVR